MNHVLHIVRSLARDTGGPARTVPELCGSLADAGVGVTLATMDLGPALGPILLPDEQRVRSYVWPTWSAKGWRLPYAPAFRQNIERICRQSNVDLIHDHGMWLQSNRAAAGVARRLGKPLIVTPRGMLAPWCLNHKAWKKRLGWKFYAEKDVSSATVIHATSELEALDLRALSIRLPIAVIPNGVPFNIEETSCVPTATDPREVLFLSRIHPKKGLPFLVEAWQQLAPSGWRVVIAGPDEGNHRQELTEMIAKAGLGDQFEFVGSVEGQAKKALYDRASLFVLPTHSENFGVVVAEALAAEVPVITTQGTPWSDLEKHRCGWWINIGTESLVKTLREALALSDEERAAMGARGRQLVQTEYTWPSIAQQMRSVYEWVLGRGSPPDCVMIN